MYKAIIFITYHLFMAFLLKFSIQSGFDHNIGMLSGLGFSLFLNIISTFFKNVNR